MDPSAGPAGRIALVGRDDERGQLRHWLDALAGLSSLTITGEAGIGKTALWEWGASAASASGFTVLSARCVATEVRLPWVGITDLLSAVPDPVLRSLPGPQRRALEIATLKSDPAEAPLDERGVGTALHTLLTRLAEAAPVLVAIDDLLWLDPASSGALRFALRRLVGPVQRGADRPVHRLALLATRRDPDTTSRHPDRSPPEGPLAESSELVLGPMSVGALYQLLHQRLALHFPRPILVQIHQTTGGNALYALELARHLDQRDNTPVPGVPLRLPPSLLGLVQDRIAALDVDLRTLVATTAATWRPPMSVIPAGVLERGLAAGVILLTDGVVRAAHPMLGAAAYAWLTGAERHDLHHVLAAAADDAADRARHLAIAVPGPDPEVAAALEAGAVTVAGRGAPAAAAELIRLALDHTADPADLPRRWERLADLLFRAGDTDGAAQAQQQSIATETTELARARRRIRLAEILVESDGDEAAKSHLLTAVQEAGDDPVVGAEAFLTLAALTLEAPVAANYANQAMALMDRASEPDPAILAGVITQVATTRFTAGSGLDHAAFARAIELERAHPTRRLSDRADAGYAALLKYADDLDAAETRLSALLVEAEESGDVSSIVYVLSHLPQIHLWRGDIAAARTVVERHRQLSEDAAMASQIPVAHYLLGVVASYAGEIEVAAGILNAEAQAATTPWARQRAFGALGFLALARGDHRSALDHLDVWYRELTAIGMGEPGWSRHHLDYAVVLVLTGRLDDAAGFLAELERKSTVSGRLSGAAAALIGQGLLAAARGDLVGARQAVEEGVAAYEALPLRFDLARARLFAGQVLRRAKAKSAAKESLTVALTEFRTFGALGWAAQVEVELARVNVRPSAPTGLTETERRVAELAARGKTNREVADSLFLSTKTVEANLGRIYRKLGISSRAELGAWLGRTSA